MALETLLTKDCLLTNEEADNNSEFPHEQNDVVQAQPVHGMGLLLNKSGSIEISKEEENEAEDDSSISLSSTDEEVRQINSTHSSGERLTASPSETKEQIEDEITSTSVTSSSPDVEKLSGKDEIIEDSSNIEAHCSDSKHMEDFKDAPIEWISSASEPTLTKKENGEKRCELGVGILLSRRRDSEPILRGCGRSQSTGSDNKVHQNGENSSSRKWHEMLANGDFCSRENPMIMRLYCLATSSYPNTSKKRKKITDFIKLLNSRGVWMTDPRLQQMYQLVEQEKKKFQTHFSPEVFARICSPECEFIRRILLSQIAIPGFPLFKQRMREVFWKLSSTLRELDNEAPNPVESSLNHETSFLSFMLSRRSNLESNLCLAVCTVDGQRMTLGDNDGYHPLNICAKILNYCLACQQNGIKTVKKEIGGKPLENPQGEFQMDDRDRVWNPFTKAGGILTSSMLHQSGENLDARLHVLHEIYSRSMAGEPIFCDNLSYNLKRLYAHEEISLAYFLSARQKLSKFSSTPADAIELYFQSTSTATSCDTSALAAAMLASGGICPLTGERIFSEDIARHVLKTMRKSYGLHFLETVTDEMGRISIAWDECGGIFLVVPGVFGLTCFTRCQPERVMRQLAVNLVQNILSTIHFSFYDRLQNGKSFSMDKKS